MNITTMFAKTYLAKLDLVDFYILFLKHMQLVSNIETSTICFNILVKIVASYVFKSHNY